MILKTNPKVKRKPNLKAKLDTIEVGVTTGVN